MITKFDTIDFLKQPEEIGHRESKLIGQANKGKLSVCKVKYLLVQLGLVDTFFFFVQNLMQGQ